ncbi:hypothetical protein EV05_1894 [Prochlorococcus sp. MIT 0601]|nr:hypothetical protein EV05_1894 [Prochlorococcus sp. MIT 0601]
MWVSIGSLRELRVDPSDPLQAANESNIFLGLVCIAVITAIEGWYAARDPEERDELSEV